VVQVSGGTLARTSSVAPSIKIKFNFRGNKGRHNFQSRAWRPALFFRDIFFAIFFSSTRSMHGAADMPTNPIQHSFELAAARCEDLTPLVYRRLFREHPEAEAMFRREGSDLVQGSMLAMAIEAMLDFAGDRSGHFRMIECEVVSHDAYSTPRKLFGEFFGVIADSLRELLGNDWSPEIDEAWRGLLTELDRVVTQT
jgi:hemoglobin-like flavoprotein